MLTIRTKLILLTSLLFIGSSVSLTLGAAYLSIFQTQRQNAIRLSTATTGLQRNLKRQLSSDAELIQETLGQRGLTTDFKTMALIEMATPEIKTQFLDLAQSLNAHHLGIYYRPENQGPLMLRHSYSQDLQGLLSYAENPKKPRLSSFDAKGFLIEDQLVNGVDLVFPPQYQSPSLTTFLQAREGQTQIVSHLDYISQFEDSTFGVAIGDNLGTFVIERPLSTHLEELNHDLGMLFTAYDVQGKMIEGSAPFPALDLENLSVKTVHVQQDEEGKLYDTQVLPLMEGKQVIGYLSASISQDVTMQKLWEIVQLLSTITAIIIVLGIGICFLIVRGALKTIPQVTALLKNIAQGEGDLTKRLSIKRRDEMGILAQLFDGFVEKIHRLMEGIQEASTQLGASSEELSNSSNLMEKNSGRISRAISEESASLHETSRTINTMVESLDEVFGRIKTIQSNAQGAWDVAEHGKQAVVRTTATMVNIESSSKRIEGITSVITEIASQINLLSLNAAIEAAKAGDTGRGFAVVADEVRRLAERSAQTVDEIQNSIQESSRSVEEGIVVIKETQTVFHQIIDEVRHISESMDQLSNEISEQEVGIHEISSGVEQVLELSDDNASAVEELSSSLSEVAFTTKDLSQLAESLMDQVNQFKL